MVGLGRTFVTWGSDEGVGEELAVAAADVVDATGVAVGVAAGVDVPAQPAAASDTRTAQPARRISRA
jgi:hypothetical protein